jgi:DNA-binding response OmpR family regulator
LSRLIRITCHQPSRQICVDGVPLDLTTKEYEIMARLVQAGGAIIERERLMSEVGDHGRGRESRALDMHVSNLRRKLGQHGCLVVTVRGIGYSLRVPEGGRW